MLLYNSQGMEMCVLLVCIYILNHRTGGKGDGVDDASVCGVGMMMTERKRCDTGGGCGDKYVAVY